MQDFERLISQRIESGARRVGERAGVRSSRSGDLVGARGDSANPPREGLIEKQPREHSPEPRSARFGRKFTASAFWASSMILSLARHLRRRRTIRLQRGATLSRCRGVSGASVARTLMTLWYR